MQQVVEGLSASDAVARRAMRLSLLVGFCMLAGKVGAWWITGSSAIMSDALESVLHVGAVGFAAFSLRLSQRPADDRFHYGYDRITYFSAGFEGGLIAIAGLGIIAAAIMKWMEGLRLERVGLGTFLVAAAAIANLALGWYLLRTGRKQNSLILEANGQHVMSDVWTSVGVVIGLVLVLVTGWLPFDPICAILVALQILYTGGQLVFRSIRGLMDYADPNAEEKLRQLVDQAAARHAVEYHELRFRSVGNRILAEVHLLFPYDAVLGKAHETATQIEQEVAEGYGRPVEIITHLEAMEDHMRVHQNLRQP